MTVHVVRYSIYHSPNAYLGAVYADEQLAGLPITLERRPIYVPRERGLLVADLVGGRETARHASYHREDCRRWSDKHGVPLHFTDRGEFQRRARTWQAGELCREELPARAYYACVGSGREAALDRALYEAAFVACADVNDEAVVRAAAEKAGLDAAELLAAARSPETKRTLEASLEAFDAAECPGVPTWVVAGERFFGKDRVELLAETVRRLASR